MRTRFAMLSGAALLATGLGFATASTRSTPQSSPERRGAAPAPQKSAAVPMVVYKSPT